MAKREKTKREECMGCRLVRTLRNYPEANYFKPGSPVEDKWICLSCANIIGLDTLLHQGDHYVNRLLLTVNSKLDLLLKRGNR